MKRVETVTAADLTVGDRVYLLTGDETAFWTVRSVARLSVTELKIQVNGLTVTYPGIDSVVAGVALGEEFKTVEFMAANVVTREAR
jgi:hypothetical protein